jgi:hypothetical protein
VRPRPESRPDVRPLVNVRDAQSTFTGPTGAAIAIPAINPFIINIKPIKSAAYR